MQKHLEFLLDKYSVDKDVKILNHNTCLIDGKEIPLNSYKNERRFLELKNMCSNGTITGISVMRTARIIESGTDIYDALRRELDLCQYILDRKFKSIMVMENGNVLNAIATMNDDVVCTLEISATLKKGEIPKDKHEIIAEHGIACDIVVDAQIAQNSIYVFGESNQAYTDVDFELYGLSIDEIAVVRSAFNLAKQNDYSEIIQYNKALDKLVELAKDSAKTGERKVVAE